MSYGNSIAIDPWGDIVGEIRSETDEDFFTFNFDK
jgi:predicted amidohydrolase